MTAVFVRRYSEPYGSVFAQLDTAFAALSDPTRRGILEHLGRRDASISDLAAKFEITLTGLKKHVHVLERSGLVTSKKVGRVRTCRLGPRRLDAERRGSTSIDRWSKRAWIASANSSSVRKENHDQSHDHPPPAAMFTTPSDREIRIERIYDAPRDRVWRAFTDPALVAQWWGRGNRLVIERMEVKKGGHWRYVEHGPDGVHGFEGRYREVTPPERLVHTFEWDGMPAHVVIETVTLEDLGDGRTRVVTTLLPTPPRSATACSGPAWRRASTRARRRSIACSQQ